MKIHNPLDNPFLLLCRGIEEYKGKVRATSTIVKVSQPRNLPASSFPVSDRFIISPLSPFT